jgi:hypothetical protein
VLCHVYNFPLTACHLSTKHDCFWRLAMRVQGRYHIDTCAVLCDERARAQKEGLILRTVQGIPIPNEAIFRKPAEPVTKPAKVDGFVISASLSPPYGLDASVPSRKKGYVRCLACGTDVWAPNSSRHRESCAKRYRPPGGSPCRGDGLGRMATGAQGSCANIGLEEASLFRQLFCDETMFENDGCCLTQAVPF